MRLRFNYCSLFTDITHNVNELAFYRRKSFVIVKNNPVQPASPEQEPQSDDDEYEDDGNSISVHSLSSARTVHVVVSCVHSHVSLLQICCFHSDFYSTTAAGTGRTVKVHILALWNARYMRRSFAILVLLSFVAR